MSYMDKVSYGDTEYPAVTHPGDIILKVPVGFIRYETYHDQWALYVLDTEDPTDITAAKTTRYPGLKAAMDAASAILDKRDKEGTPKWPHVKALVRYAPGEPLVEGTVTSRYSGGWQHSLKVTIRVNGKGKSVKVRTSDVFEATPENLIHAEAYNAAASKMREAAEEMESRRGKLTVLDYPEEPTITK